MKPDDQSVFGNRPFFIPGGTLPGDAPSYVTRQADHNLLEGLRGGQFCYVLTSRQMGKSSLMVRTANRLREESVAVAVLDLTALGQNLSVEQWYFGLLEQLGRHLRLEDELDDYWQAHRGLGPMQRWMAAIRDVALSSRSQQIVVFVDEIDIVRSLPFSTDEFFGAIRECYNRRAQEPQYEKLTFCLLGVATPNDLIKNTLMTPFNIGRRIELTDFTSEEAAPLSAGISMTERDGQALLNQSLYWTGGNPLLNRVLYWTGGHPYLTQRLCKLVAEDTAAVWDEDVDRLCANLFLAHKAMESDTNLQFVRNRLLQSEVDLTALLDLYARARQGGRVADDETNPLTSILKLSGIVRVERGELKVRNRIYAQVFNREWVRAHIPGAELRRQRAAYRQGLMRAGAVASAVVGVMGCLTLWAVQAQQQANRYRVKAEKAATVERTLSSLSDQQRKGAERTAYFANMKLISDAYDASYYDRTRAQQYNRIGELLKELKQDKYRPYYGFEWGYWNRLMRRVNLQRLKGSASSANVSPLFNEGTQTVTGRSVITLNMRNRQYERPCFLLWGDEAKGVAAFSPDGTQVVAVALIYKMVKTGMVKVSTCMKIWDTKTGEEKLTHTWHDKIFRSVAYSPDGQHIVIGSHDKTAMMLDARTGQVNKTFRGHTDVVKSVAYSPDGTRVVTGSDDNTARVWDVQTGQAVLILTGHKKGSAGYLTGSKGVTSVTYSPDGQHIVTGSVDKTAMVWDAQTGHLIQILRGHPAAVESVAYSPDGTRVVTGSSDGTTRVWDVQTGQAILTLVEGSSAVDSIKFSPDGQRIAMGGSSGMACDTSVWDAQTGQKIMALPDGAGLGVFSPDGKRILTAASNVSLWVGDPID